MLLVEGDPSMLEMYRLRLEQDGYRVTTALDGEDAVNKACELAPDMIVLDIRRPRTEGLEVLRKLQAGEKTRAIPLVVLSSDNEQDPVTLEDIGIIAAPVEPPASGLSHLVAAIPDPKQRVVAWLALGILSTFALVFFVIYVLELLLHLWVLPIVLGVAAFRQRRADRKAAQSAAAGGAMVPPRLGYISDGEPITVDRRPFVSRHRRGVALFFLVVGVVTVPWSHYVNHDPWSQAPLWVLSIWGLLGACWWNVAEFAKATDPHRTECCIMRCIWPPAEPRSI